MPFIEARTLYKYVRNNNLPVDEFDQRYMSSIIDKFNQRVKDDHHVIRIEGWNKQKSDLEGLL